jgi:hypothetical protein
MRIRGFGEDDMAAFLGAVRTVLVVEGSGANLETNEGVSIRLLPDSGAHEEGAFAGAGAGGAPFLKGVVTIFFYIGGVSKEYRPFYLKVFPAGSCLGPCLP